MSIVAPLWPCVCYSVTRPLLYIIFNRLFMDTSEAAEH
uniref:Uncharacterized protein n=1 Tax=Arundo donax TaxID=35708 RepID=A0A0A9DRP1_ARUDO